MISSLPMSKNPFRSEQRWYGTNKRWALDHRLFDALHHQDPRLVFYIPAGTVVTRIIEFAREGAVATKKDVRYTFADMVTVAEEKSINTMERDVVFTFRFCNGYDMNGIPITQMIEVDDDDVIFEHEGWK